MNAIVHRTNGQSPEIVAGKPGKLSPREFEALLCTAEGLTTEFTAEVMGCTERTAKSHIESGMNKLGAINRAHYIALASARGQIVYVDSEAGHATVGMMLVNLVAGIALALSLIFFNPDLIRPRGRPQQLRLRGRELCL